jgi:hypothetical protein
VSQEVTRDEVPLTTQIQCAKRELKMRQRVYPRLIAGGQLTRQTTDRELAAMQAIVQTLQQLMEEKQLELFA